MAWRNPLSIDAAIARAENSVRRERAPNRLTGRFLLKGVVLSLLVAGSVVALATRYSIGSATQEHLCLPPYRLWLIDKFDKEPVRGEIYAFKAKGLGPIFSDGTLIVKVLDGMPGDAVEVSPEQTTINGRLVATGLAVADKYDLDPSRYVRQGTIEAGRFWFFGRTDDSFDSRYWGSVDHSQIMGRAYPLW